MDIAETVYSKFDTLGNYFGCLGSKFRREDLHDLILKSSKNKSGRILLKLLATFRYILSFSGRDDLEFLSCCCSTFTRLPVTGPIRDDRTGRCYIHIHTW